MLRQARQGTMTLRLIDAEIQRCDREIQDRREAVREAEEAVRKAEAQKERFMNQKRRQQGGNDELVACCIRQRFGTFAVIRLMAGSRKISDEVWNMILEAYYKFPSQRLRIDAGSNPGMMARGYVWCRSQREYVEDFHERGTPWVCKETNAPLNSIFRTKQVYIVYKMPKDEVNILLRLPAWSKSQWWFQRRKNEEEADQNRPSPDTSVRIIRELTPDKVLKIWICRPYCTARGLVNMVLTQQFNDVMLAATALSGALRHANSNYVARPMSDRPESLRIKLSVLRTHVDKVVDASSRVPSMLCWAASLKILCDNLCDLDRTDPLFARIQNVSSSIKGFGSRGVKLGPQSESGVSTVMELYEEKQLNREVELHWVNKHEMFIGVEPGGDVYEIL